MCKNKKLIVVNSARSWLGTKFCHQGRIKKTLSHTGAVDCLGLLIGVAQEEKLTCKNGVLLEKFDEKDYPLITKTDYLSKTLDKLLIQKNLKDLDIADLILFKFNDCPDHLAIVTTLNPTRIIHAYIQARKVSEHYLSDNFKHHIYKVYSLI